MVVLQSDRLVTWRRRRCGRRSTGSEGGAGRGRDRHRPDAHEGGGGVRALSWEEMAGVGAGSQDQAAEGAADGESDAADDLVEAHGA